MNAAEPAPAYNKAITIFQGSVGDQSLLYNGPAYIFLRDLKTNPFLGDTKLTSPGSVVYYGFAYNDIPLMYDIERDLVITTWNDNESLFALHSDKVSQFKMSGHHFIRITPNNAEPTTPPTGFYDALFTGKVQLLARRTKAIHIMQEQKSDQDVYEYHVRYYLKKGNKYLNITSRTDLISALGDHEAELKRFLKDNRSDSEEQDMIRLAGHYDSLTN